MNKRFFTYLFLFLDQLKVGLVLPILPFLLKENLLNLSTSTLDTSLKVFLVLSYPLFAIFFTPLFGHLWDQKSKSKVWLTVGLGFTCSLFLFSLGLFLRSWLCLTLAQVIHGVFGSLTSLSISELTLHKPDQKTKQLEMHLVTTFIGIAWITGYLCVEFFFLFDFPVASSVGFALFGVIAFLISLIAQFKHIFSPKASYETPPKNLLKSFQPFFSKELRIFRIVLYLFYLGFFLSFLWTIPIAYRSFALSSSTLNILFYAIPLVFALTALVATGCIIPFLDSLMLSVWALFLGGLLLFVAAASTSFTFFAMTLLLAVCACSLAYSNLLALISSKTHDTVLGLSFGLAYALIFLALTTAPVLGFFISLLENSVILYIGGFSLFMAFAILLTYLIRKNPQMLRY